MDGEEGGEEWSSDASIDWEAMNFMGKVANDDGGGACKQSPAAASRLLSKIFGKISFAANRSRRQMTCRTVVLRQK